MAESSAERIFAEFVLQHQTASLEDENGLCAKHPELEDELRRMMENWRLLCELEGSVTVSGPGDAEGTGPGAGNEELLERLSLVRRGERRRYRDLGRVGRGGMGEIRRVIDQDLRRVLAVKFALEDSAASPGVHGNGITSERVTRFLEEAQVTSQLDHPGIVPVHELGVDEAGRPFFTMKLVRGEDLSRILERTRMGDEEWNTTRLLSVILRAAEAISFAHSKSVIHRDIKPANIMVGHFGEAYVMDWGLARVLGRGKGSEHRALEKRASTSRVETFRDVAHVDSPLLTEDGRVIGTPIYMSPEQARGEVDSLDARTDVYAMGAILYELLAGQRPYAGGRLDRSPSEVLGDVVAGPPPAITNLNPKAAGELVAIAEKAMARDSSRRYPTMLEFVEDLRAFLEQRVVRAYGSGAIAQLSKWVERNRAFAGTIGVALLSIIGLAGWALNEANNANRERRRLAVERARLADVVLLDQLLAESEDLWPAVPSQVPQMTSWLRQATGLLHRRDEFEAWVKDLGKEDKSVHRWASVAAGIRSLADPDLYAPTIAAVAARLEFAKSIEESSISGPTVASAWREALPEIRVKYGIPEFGPQLGLVPLGVNGESKLWEFWHVATGDRPDWSRDGRFNISAGDGLVLVLIPGGKFRLGNHDEEMAGSFVGLAMKHLTREERPGPVVHLGPYFLSKFEMSLAQWKRVTGDDPNFFRRKGSVVPVESVSWMECSRWMKRLGLSLPTEFQWEHACRAGTQTAWWTGSAVDERLMRAANVADLPSRGTHRWRGHVEMEAVEFVRHFRDDYNDGRLMLAAVDSFEPNPYGLHHVHGNVWEWCKDRNLIPGKPGREGDGLRGEEMMKIRYRVRRGGSFKTSIIDTRSGQRNAQFEGYADVDLGLRPARAIDM